MRLSSRAAGHCLLGIFALSGFAGLIYQSIWSHYLGLILGHAAYAQTLVLAIFMGGMALGAGLASRWMPRLRHLVLAYGMVEGVIGLAGLVFHPLFLAATAMSQETILPQISSEGVAQAWQWGLATMLIAPQSILLGATFPLLSGAYLRISPTEDTGILGGLYFTNSVGAAFGALFSTFVLLPWMGMPGAVVTAGIINIAVALLAFGVWKWLPAPDRGEVSVASASPASPAGSELRRLDRVLMWAAFITGATSFFYEVCWVRMLNMALGTTVHSFELMLAAFIFGLAMGGLWVRRRGADIRDVVAYSGYAQVLMGVTAMASLLAFAHSFSAVEWLMSALARSETGYTLFAVGSAVVALFVMFPAAFFAGMTLPLFTAALLRSGAGEKVIGRIYSANTLGAIVGVALVVHAFIPGVGLRFSTWLAALADIALGLYLLRAISPGRATAGLVVALVVGLMAAGGAMVFGRADPADLTSGVYRTGELKPIGSESVVAYLRDGKTATVSVKKWNESAVIIATNGKPDAAVAPSLRDPPALDEWTMTMLGALPLIEHPDPKRVAIIGWGSGLTVHTLLGSPLPEHVDAIEIEPAMYDGARLFGERVSRAYKDPRVQVHFEDARTYFATGNRRFDVVISEPSNPWVSGVASLFTVEFYEFVRRHLEDDGILVQWIHTYELSDELLATMLSALVREFPAVDVYSASDNDLILVARSTKRAEFSRDWSRLRERELGQELTRLGLLDAADFVVRYLGDERILKTFVKVSGAGPHSDFQPMVSLQGPKARFMKRNADSLYTLVLSGLPVLDMLTGRIPPGSLSRPASTGNRVVIAHEDARFIRDALRDGRVAPALRNRAAVTAAGVTSLLRMSAEPVGSDTLRLWSAAASAVSRSSLGHLRSEELVGAWIDPAWIDRANRHHPAVPAILDALAATARRDAVAMRSTALEALRLGEDGLAPAMSERLLVIAMLGAYATGGTAAMAEVHQRYGKSIPTGELGFIRSFLLEWEAAP